MCDSQNKESSKFDINYDDQNRSGPNLAGEFEELEKKIEEDEKKEQKKEQMKKDRRKNDEIICQKCGFIPEIQFINNNKLNIICDCQINKNYDIIGFEKEYIYNNSDEQTDDQSMQSEEKSNEQSTQKTIKRANCSIHNSKFQYYCNDCFKDICEECLKNKSFHVDHQVKKYSVDMKLIEDIKEVIDEFEKKVKEGNSNIKEEDKKIIEIFKRIIQYYKYPDYQYPYNDFLDFINTPCQNFIRNIENAHNFLSNFKEHKNRDKSNIMNVNENLNQNELTIKTKRDLIQKMNLIEQIYEIEIDEQNFNDLRIFEGKHFKNLKLLNLEENNIRDISPLLKAKFDQLDVLNLARNKIDNRIIDNIKKFDEVFPVLGVLNVFHNYITDYDIFNEINNKIKGLRILYIGSNKFDEKTIGKINKNLYFKNLEKVGFTNGVVSDSTVNTIFTYFKIEKISILYLDGNNLSCLSFVKKINFSENVETLWLSKNNLDEYELISKCNFKKLKDLNLSNNRINNIKNLEHFINVQKELSILYLSGNKFDLYDCDVKKIKEKMNKNKRVQIIFD